MVKLNKPPLSTTTPLQASWAMALDEFAIHTAVATFNWVAWIIYLRWIIKSGKPLWLHGKKVSSRDLAFSLIVQLQGSGNRSSGFFGDQRVQLTDSLLLSWRPLARRCFVSSKMFTYETGMRKLVVLKKRRRLLCGIKRAPRWLGCGFGFGFGA